MPSTSFLCFSFRLVSNHRAPKNIGQGLVHVLPEPVSRRGWRDTELFSDCLPIFSQASHLDDGTTSVAQAGQQLVEIQTTVDLVHPIGNDSALHNIAGYCQWFDPS